MNRREFLANASHTAIYSALFLHSPFVSASDDHPVVIDVLADGDSLSIPLQTALHEAYDLWVNDALSRRPIIRIPAGNYIIDDIPNNNRGNYPFRLPPTFKLMGAGKSETRIASAQPHGAQYRFLMTRPQTRIDVIAACPSLDGSCVSQSITDFGPIQNVEISGITFVDFDNAISFVESDGCCVKNCAFIGSLVGVQLFRGNQYGNKRALFENCDFDSIRTNGEKLRFSLRFETPFYGNWSKQVNNVASREECESLGVGAVNYDAATQECEVTDDQEVIDYLNELFGNSYSEDVANTHCLVSNCTFTNASYSAVEFAGTLNTFNRVEHCLFHDCDGTAIEFDKGASFNTAFANSISAMRPTTVFAPRAPYVFQAAIQEQEGAHTADRQLKEVIEAYGFADEASATYKGSDIFERAALLPVGNQILENQFDVSRVYWLSDYESDASVRATLPDVYPSIKLSKSKQTKVIGNSEFIGNTGSAVTDASRMGASIALYPDDTLRDSRGDIEIRDNKMHGAFFIIAENDQVNLNMPCVVENNEFGQLHATHRGGLLINGCIADSLTIRNNKFYCSENGSATSMQRLSINHFVLDTNEFYLKPGNTFYLRCQDADIDNPRITEFTHNLVRGGLALTMYDWTSPGLPSMDTLHFNSNHLDGLYGGTRVVGATLWYANLTMSDNHFDALEDKIFQFYGLSDSINYSPKNTLTLGANSQSRAYSRNYANTQGTYVTNDFWYE